MHKHIKIALALAIGVALAQGAYAWGNGPDGYQETKERTGNHDVKGTQTANGSVLLIQGLTAVAPLPRGERSTDYMHNVWGDSDRKGKLERLYAMADTLIAGDPEGFAQRRISELSLAASRRDPDPEVKLALTRWQRCRSEACVCDLTQHEVYGYIAQAAGQVQPPSFMETTPGGWRNVPHQSFAPWVTALIYHGELASRIEYLVLSSMPKAGMSLADRRLALTTAFYDVPIEQLIALDNEVRDLLSRTDARLLNGQPGSPYEIVANGRHYIVDKRGITITEDGSQVFGGGYVQGVEIKFSDERGTGTKNTHSTGFTAIGAKKPVGGGMMPGLK